MKIPPLSALRLEDFPSEQEWIGRLLQALNPFLTAMVQAFSQNITLGDNIPCQTQSLSFTYGGTSDLPKRFAYKLKNPPVELRVASATEDGVPVGVTPVWSYENGVVSLPEMSILKSGRVSALTEGSRYVVVMRIQP